MSAGNIGVLDVTLDLVLMLKIVCLRVAILRQIRFAMRWNTKRLYSFLNDNVSIGRERTSMT